MQFTETCSLRTEELSQTFTLQNTNRMEKPNKLLSLSKSSSGLNFLPKLSRPQSNSSRLSFVGKELEMLVLRCLIRSV